MLLGIYYWGYTIGDNNCPEVNLTLNDDLQTTIATGSTLIIVLNSNVVSQTMDSSPQDPESTSEYKVVVSTAVTIILYFQR